MKQFEGVPNTSVIHTAVLFLLRNGYSMKDVVYYLNEELEGLGTASEYVEAINEKDFRP